MCTQDNFKNIDSKNKHYRVEILLTFHLILLSSKLHYNRCFDRILEQSLNCQPWFHRILLKLLKFWLNKLDMNILDFSLEITLKTKASSSTMPTPLFWSNQSCCVKRSMVRANKIFNILSSIYHLGLIVITVFTVQCTYKIDCYKSD